MDHFLGATSIDAVAAHHRGAILPFWSSFIVILHIMIDVFYACLALLMLILETAYEVFIYQNYLFYLYLYYLV